MERWNWQLVQAQLLLYKYRRRLAPAAVPVLQGWIETCLSQVGRDLRRDEACQELWCFILEGVIPRINMDRGNFHSLICLCIRQKIAKIRKMNQRAEKLLTNMEDLYRG